MRRPLASALAVLAFLSFVPRALAWNGEAHQLVAWIAEARLSDKTKAGVKELLGDAELSDAEVVSWADEIRRERRETAPWHYVSIPIDSDGYDPKRDGNAGDNVIEGRIASRELAITGLVDEPARQTKRALKKPQSC